MSSFMTKHITQHLVHIPVGTVMLEGELLLPSGTQGVVVFAHGSGSSRHSPRNTFVARVLQAAGLGTLLFDLLTRAEDTDYETRFDIALLTRRLSAATHWLQQQPQTKALAIGYFGASTGAAAALQAAATLGSAIKAVVSRGGRPDLARAALPHVMAPTLLIVGGEDHDVIELNREAYALLHSEKQLTIVPGATHLFEEPGTLEEVARLASQWFVQHLKAQQTQSS
jgi:dienelactone hydrolase